MDDDEFASTVVCAILQKDNLVTTCADDGEAAVDLWDEQSATGQLLDVVRPPHTSPRPCFRGSSDTSCLDLRCCSTGSLAAVCPGSRCSNISMGKKTCAATVEPASFAPPSLTCAALVQLSPAARVIMLSGNDPSEDDRNLFLQAGAAAFWVKPVTAHQIQSLALAKSK